jgi:hypothetical protein
MDTFLVVRVLDVNYAPQAPKLVSVSLDGGPKQPLKPTDLVGVLELQLPAGASRLVISVEQAGFWPVSQSLRLVAGRLPTVSFDGAQAINVRDLEAHTRGDDANVVVNVVLGQVKDAQAKVDAVVQQGGIFTITPGAHFIRDLDAALLDPNGKGWDRLKHKVSSGVVPDGRMFFVERQTAPKLIAIYKPAQRFQTFQRDATSPVNLPVPYHVFFHPSTSRFEGAYPFSTKYIDLISRYMLLEQTHNVGKAMINQHVVSTKRPVFVFPVGSPTESFGKIPRQADLLRLIQELNFWLQRMDGIAYPAHPVGLCAASAFSAGCEALRTMLQTPFPKFDEKHLREIYGFDLFTPSDIPGMCTSLVRWFRRGEDKRKLRIYTQDGTWRAQLQAKLSHGRTTSGPSNAFEDETVASTVLFDPLREFWNGVAAETAVRPQFGRLDNVPGKITDKDLADVEDGTVTLDAVKLAKYYEVHSMHPALFMTHALKLSSFAD